MGSRIDFSSHITISDRSFVSGILRFYNYTDLTDEFIQETADNMTIKYVQISKSLPFEAFEAIDRLLALREDMHFRIFDLTGEDKFDLSCLLTLKHLRHLTLDVHLINRQDFLDLSVLTKLEHLETLHLILFDLRDYSFVKELSAGLKELYISADTMSGGIVFDCEWLARYTQLERLYLGQKAKKHIESIVALPSLKELTLRGIKLDSLHFLKQINLESLAVHLCGMNDLSSLCGFDTIKNLELWRIAKLEDISFISTLTALETLTLRELKHIKSLPDLSSLKSLQAITLDGLPINIASLPQNLQDIITR